MKKHLTYIAIASLIFIVGCEKDNPTGTISGTTTNIPSFSGYTATDNNGIPTGLFDTTDWTHDANWTASEENLFSGYQNLTNDFPHYTSTQLFPAYPNPTASITNFQLMKDPDVRFSFRVVNQNFNVLASIDSLYSNSFALNTAGMTSLTDTLLRVYYYFERNDSCLYQGHGDIKVN